MAPFSVRQPSGEPYTHKNDHTHRRQLSSLASGALSSSLTRRPRRLLPSYFVETASPGPGTTPKTPTIYSTGSKREAMRLKKMQTGRCSGERKQTRKDRSMATTTSHHDDIGSLEAEGRRTKQAPGSKGIKRKVCICLLSLWERPISR